MQEPEVSLRIAMSHIRDGKTHSDVFVSIDGAHIKTNNTIHFDITAFMHENGYEKCDCDTTRWQGTYQNANYAPRIIVSSKPGMGDVVIFRTDGTTLFIESKKFKKEAAENILQCGKQSAN